MDLVRRAEPPSQDDFTQPCAETPPQTFSWVSDSLAIHPDLIKARFHFGRFVTVVVNAEAEHAEIQALQSGMDSVSLWIDISLYFFAILHYRSSWPQLPFLSRKL
jgi:hypothetical protein